MNANTEQISRKEVTIAGFGGQGIVLTGFILGKALALYEDRQVVMTQSYGPEARGGASSANLVISDETIDYPFVQRPDILVTISQEAYKKFRPRLKETGLILIDEDLVKPDPGDHVLAIPATGIAETLGKRIVANVVMLGFIAGATSLASRDSLIRSIESSVKTKTIPLNIEAFDAGYEFMFEGKFKTLKTIQGI